MNNIVRFKMLWYCLTVAILSTTVVAEPFDSRDQTLVIGLSVWSGYPTSVSGFKAGLAEAGLVEGKNVRFVVGNADGDKEKQKQVVESFKLAEVDLVYSLTTPGTMIVKEIMPSTTPIVFSIVTYPADSGLIESFDYSGNNLVGTSNFVPYPNYIFMLEKILPEVKSVAIFHRKGEPNSKIQAINLRRILRKRGVEVSIVEPSNHDEVEFMALAIVDKVDCFIVTTDTLMQAGGEKILIRLSLARKIPILSSNKAGIENGATFGPVADFYTIGKISGGIAANILKNKTRPTQLNSQLQDPPQFLVNPISLKRLGLTIPSDLNVSYTQ